ncbi:MAG TPA: CPBP family intramembrane glutamic endopeptidase [Blastocatellia bacterium]|jgi:hypothetical protein|nr:CPBP family intramembrane glutamic endopeptidase [Blastocatellia bacterium]
MKGTKVFIFLLVAFLWAWTNWFIGLRCLAENLDGNGVNRFVNFFFIGVYGPSLSAILTSFYFGGFRESVALLKKLIIWQAPLTIYVAIFVVPILFLMSGIGLYAWFVGPIGHFDKHAIVMIPHVLWGAIFAGPLGEELGWRGLLLPELQKKFSAFQSSLIVGVIWYGWHIPLFYAPFGTLVSGQPLAFIPLLVYLVFVICLSCIYTWLVNNSKGSVLIAMLIHLSINAGIALLFFPELKNGYKMCYLLSTTTILLLTTYLGIKTGFDSSVSTRIDEREIV